MSFQSRRLQLGPLAVVVETDEASILNDFELLFAGFGDAPAKDPILTVRIVRADLSSPAEPMYRALFDGKPVGGQANQNQVALAVTRKLNRAVLDAEPEVLHLHAGAVRDDHSVVLVIGSSFAGKSTLVAKLVAEGWRYLSDQQVGITPDGKILSYPRPITLRRNSWPLFDHLADVEVPTDADVAADRFELSPTVLGAIDHSSPSRPTLVICPDAASEAFYVEPLTTAETLELFVRDSLDLERAADVGIEAMLAVAASAPGYRVGGQDLDQKLQAIVDFAGKAEAPGEPVEQTVVADDEAGVRVEGALGWLFIDGSGAVYEPVTGSLVRFDESGYRSWQSLGVAERDWPEGLAWSGFVAELTEAGLLHGGDA